MPATNVDTQIKPPWYAKEAFSVALNLGGARVIYRTYEAAERIDDIFEIRALLAQDCPISRRRVCPTCGQPTVLAGEGDLAESMGANLGGPGRGAWQAPPAEDA